jgi:fatty acid-binding protein DegV
MSAVPLDVSSGAQRCLNTELSSDESYRRLPTADPLPTTSSLSVGEYQAFYRDLAQNGPRPSSWSPSGG